MSKKVGTLNFSDMISWLRDDFEKEGFKSYDAIEEDPHFPIDLFCTKGKGSGKEYCFVLVTSTDTISEQFQKKLLFYQYYLSLHYQPSQYKVILAIPDSAKVNTTPFYADEEWEKKQDFYLVNGFGLWKIKDKNNIDKTTYKEISLRNKISRDFDQIIAKDKELKKKILPFVDKYIHDSVLGIANYYPVKFQERHFDPRLLEKSLNLKKVVFKDIIFDLMNKHLSLKNKSDFDCCTNTFNNLWSDCFNKEIYPGEHRRLEPLLLDLYPKYRDHYIHQLQVFLLGLIIIDLLLQNKKMEVKNEKKLCKSWLLASSFHDFAYPIQKYDDYISCFFRECLSTDNKLGYLDLKNDYTEFSFSSNMEYILSSIAKCFDNKKFSGENGINNYNKIRLFFYHKITKCKNHSLVGGLGLLKKFEDKNKIDFSNIILPAAVAIALHDDEIWQTLHGLKADSDYEWTSNVEKLAPLQRLDFKIHPIAFLLILCDNIQDWGRHFKDEKLEIQIKEANIRLKDIFFDSDKLVIQLFLNDTRESRKFMIYKERILAQIEKLLKTSDYKIIIEYWDSDKNESTSYNFKIGI